MSRWLRRSVTALPRLHDFRFEGELAGLDPGGIVFLHDGGSIAEECGNGFDRNAFLPKRNRKRIAHHVRMALDAGELQEFSEASLPIGNGGFRQTIARPEKIFFTHGWTLLERFQDKWRKRQKHRHAGLLRPQEHLSILHCRSFQANDVANPEAGVSQEKHERPHPRLVSFSVDSIRRIEITGP